MKMVVFTSHKESSLAEAHSKHYEPSKMKHFVTILDVLIRVLISFQWLRILDKMLVINWKLLKWRAGSLPWVKVTHHYFS